MVSAFTMPHPIYGRLYNDGVPVSGVAIDVDNLDSGAEGTSVTNNNGFFQVDLGNIDDRYRDDDRIEVSLAYCKELEKCRKVVLVSGGGNEVTFDVSSESLPELPEAAVVVNYLCWNGDAVEDSDDCPVQTTPAPVIQEKIIDRITEKTIEKLVETPVEKIVEKIVDREVEVPVSVPEEIFICEDGSEVDDPEDCPVSSSLLWKIVSGALLVFGAAAIALFYTNRRKYKWIPGMVGIIKRYNDEANKLMRKGKKKEAEKKRATALKTMNTITKKYLGENRGD